MKTKAIQLTVVMMMLTATLFAQKANDKNVWTSMTLKGADKVEIRMVIPDKEVVVLNVFDNMGQKVFTTHFKNKKNLLVSHDISSFPSGVYTYEITNRKQVVSSTQIVKVCGHDLVYKPLDGIAATTK